MSKNLDRWPSGLRQRFTKPPKVLALSVGSNPSLSVCFGSVCFGSVCFGSVCFGSVCFGSVFLGPFFWGLLLGSAVGENFRGSSRGKRLK